jgi:hypothetical protein
MFKGESHVQPILDPKLPEVVRKAFRSCWGHFIAFDTRLVVHVTRKVTSKTVEPRGHFSK